MTSPIPIMLKGANLGERHRYLNSLVADFYSSGESFETIVNLSESSPVDRLFKIELASKHKNVEYILKTLRDDDLLYVSRALKSKWLLNEEHSQIIAPAYLEDSLYPSMITTAVNKMKHWIYINLDDSTRCLEFFEYYREKDFDYALKFLRKCPEHVILNELQKEKIFHKITPHLFKILCERSHNAAEVCFEMFKKDKKLYQSYNMNATKYFDALKCILKTNPELYLNIIEKDFMAHFKRLSSEATKFIMVNHKDRFMSKAELYSSRILNIDILSQCLTEEECEELIFKLARAKYLVEKEHWFNYKNIEPLVKRLNVEKRADFKKKIFVDKDFGEPVMDWPYSVPECISFPNEEPDVFLDDVESPDQYDRFGESWCLSDEVVKCGMYALQSRCKRFIKPKTLLDVLFDEYRFTSFNKTLFDLRKKITSESSSQNRMFMMLVLVSKSGGKPEYLELLVQLLIEHQNEPPQVRAAVIRSLVKRACVWRVTEDIWKDLMIFGRGLGLDGAKSEVDCDEGLHAVVIRTLLSDGQCNPAIKNAYIKRFSTLTSYSLTSAEKGHIKDLLLNILLESANSEKKYDSAAEILQYAIDTLLAYNIKIETRPEVVLSIKHLVAKDQKAFKQFLICLFNSKLGRKELIKENFDFIQTDASYVNALKHDVTILSVGTFLKAIKSDKLTANQFLKKITIYFGENEGLAHCFLIAIKKTEIQNELAKPLVYLSGSNLKSYLSELDTKSEKTKRFYARVTANVHLARPALDIDCHEWRKYGAKFIANKVLKCKKNEIRNLLKQLLSWKRTARLAVILAQRTNYENEVFEDVAKMKPTVALKCALSYFRRNGEQSDLRIWKIVKPLIFIIKDSIKASSHLLRNIRNIKSIPLSIRPEYATEVFKVVIQIDFQKSASVLCQIMLVLPNIEESFIEDVLHDYIKNRFILDEKHLAYANSKILFLYSKILGKYLLLCKTTEQQNIRFETVGQMYLDRLQTLWESGDKKTFFKYLDGTISSLKYNEVFLNEDYVCCLPVMEKIVKWMKAILPIDKYFNKYVPLHLTMLYYKAIRQTIKKLPEVLQIETRKHEGSKVVGEVFGKYIGHEARILAAQYFDSIVVLYGKGVVHFIRNFNEGKYKMIPYITKGMVEVSDGIECFVPLHFYDENVYLIKDDEIKQLIVNCFNQKKFIEFQFFLSHFESIDF